MNTLKGQNLVIDVKDKPNSYVKAVIARLKELGFTAEICEAGRAACVAVYVKSHTYEMYVDLTIWATRTYRPTTLEDLYTLDWEEKPKLKLRVGGVYRARNGEAVRIVRTSILPSWPFVGDTSLSYAANGQWDPRNHDDERVYDLIEEIPTTPHTIDGTEYNLTADELQAVIDALPEGLK